MFQILSPTYFFLLFVYLIKFTLKNFRHVGFQYAKRNFLYNRHRSLPTIGIDTYFFENGGIFYVGQCIPPRRIFCVEQCVCITRTRPHHQSNFPPFPNPPSPHSRHPDISASFLHWAGSRANFAKFRIRRGGAYKRVAFAGR